MKSIIPVLLVFFWLCAGAQAASSEKGITYTLNNPESWPADVRERITKAMDEATELYNKYGDGKFTKKLWISYNPGVPTADGNYNGSIRFGSMINTRTAMHEIAHTLGIGQHQRYQELMQDHQWTGRRAIRQLQQFDGKDAVLKGDGMHFWPYGLNYDTEDGKKERERHVLMVYAMVRDMGIETAR